MSIDIKKIASVMSEKIRALSKTNEVLIDNDDWKKSKKKAEIVDLWHQVAKAGNNGPGDYNRSFPFTEVEKHGVTFWCYGNGNPGMGKVVKKKLDALGVKCNTDND